MFGTKKIRVSRDVAVRPGVGFFFVSTLAQPYQMLKFQLPESFGPTWLGIGIYRQISFRVDRGFMKQETK
jgi:hypothetical protein